ncbi:NADH dehydrogenase [ubiquinone] 1 alpha subcomplex subunit 5 isoform X1 [Panthera tigris]|uniref:NADH dehydrogenase [ubiquinone] 1 alpha subcomplex subunit 5 isoform X1 n=1 Tax=Panthera leo TaxID=9689 RepID=UPI001C698221|nr:NADH dehydrogenase [ubiquinone] 1 alpha subcomplex subunit 5 isoform X1 [Panthera leo]XP_042827013.1 NADH dehydrogenase [ubiquinone] 1 alpha subcomplex subunit 5 isoform X1 [Panthera tigris]XP_049497717.1 NADH dehydrogenase [ubiquinone] 1 alpha subcomplex subunit 5 isoform X1 [Panthera uncia]
MAHYCLKLNSWFSLSKSISFTVDSIFPDDDESSYSPGWSWTSQLRLRILYTKILDVLEQIPKNAAYRKYTEQITNEKLSMVKAEPDVKKLEDQLQGGQLEEVILQAENELSLARKMIQWKPWEPLVEEPPANQWKWPI